MKSLGCALILLLTATAARAEETIASDRIIDAADRRLEQGRQAGPCIAGDDAAERRADYEIGIYIYLRDKEHELLKLAAAAPDKVWGRAEPGGIYGQEPSIAGLPNGSIAITSQNDAIGRDRWHQTLTLAYRNNAFLVAGYSYDFRDNLEPNNSYSCDYNVLTGKVTKDGKMLKADAKTVSIRDWQDDIGQKACGNGK